MRKRKFWIIIIIGITLLALTGCKGKDENLEMEKCLSEIHFLENRCITIVNKLISDEYKQKSGELDWDLIKDDYYVLDKSLSVILVDLASNYVSNQNIIELENNFNNLSSFIQAKDINGFSQALCDCYSFVSTKILDSFDVEKTIKQDKELKSNFLYVGIKLKSENSEDALKYLQDFENLYEKLNQDAEYLESHYYQINRMFIEIQKLKKLIEKNDFESSKDVFLQILKTL